MYISKRYRKMGNAVLHEHYKLANDNLNRLDALLDTTGKDASLEAAKIAWERSWHQIDEEITRRIAREKIDKRNAAKLTKQNKRAKLF